MRIKKWEKWYWGIILGFLAIEIIIICSLEKFEFTYNNQPKVYTEFTDKLKASLLMSLAWLVFFFLIWLIAKIFVKDDDFVCKRCRKEYNKSMETEKEVCKSCYEKNRTN